MNMAKLAISIFLTFVLCFSIDAFYVRGVVKDESGTPVPAAHVYIPEKRIGASADLDGYYELEIPNGELPTKFHFQATAVGYSQRDTFVTIRSDTTILNITLFSQALIAEPVIVTASRVEQRLLDAGMTTTVATGDELAAKATAGLDNAISYVPGVSMNKYQLSVRNSSGYSHGCGSRVGMLMDGIPLLSGDSGEIKWDVLPVSSVAQVEVVKGSGSSLYGSGSMGGTINIITETPRQRMLTVSGKLGIYDSPHWDEWKWSTTPRAMESVGFKLGNKIKDVAYLIEMGGTHSDNYRENDDFSRTKFFGKLHWSISKDRSLTAFTNIGYEDRGNYFEWKSQSDALEVADGHEDDRTWSSKAFSAITYRGDSPEKHLFFTLRLYNIFTNWNSSIFNVRADTFESEASLSNKVGMDSQVMFTWKRHLLTVGGEANFSQSISTTFRDHIGAGGALFIQDEYSRFHPLVLTGGMRFDGFWVDSATTDLYMGMSPKITAVYHVTDQSAVRSSFSSGFRIPSLTELFAKTNAGGILSVQPNPELDPERAYTAEVGGNYVFNGFLLDGAIFYNYYFDMIEPVPISGINIQFRNITEAQIYGTELTARWTWRKWRLNSGYLYTESWDLDKHEVMPYRPKHTFTFSAEVNPIKHLTLGLDWKYRSKMEYGLYKTDQKVEQKVLDLQAKAHSSLGAVTFRVNNVMNYNYVEIERNLAPIRHYMISIDFNVY